MRRLTLTVRLSRGFRDDRPNGSWNPTPIQTTIEFRDAQATYTFPVGVTTLWWYAPSASLDVDATEGAREGQQARKPAHAKQAQEPFTVWVHADVNGERQRPIEMAFR